MKVMKDTKGGTRCLRTLIPHLAESFALSAVTQHARHVPRRDGEAAERRNSIDHEEHEVRTHSLLKLAEAFMTFMSFMVCGLLFVFLLDLLCATNLEDL